MRPRFEAVADDCEMRWNGIRLVERRGFSMEDAKLYAETPENVGIDDCFFYHIVAHHVKGSALHPRLQKDILQRAGPPTA